MSGYPRQSQPLFQQSQSSSNQQQGQILSSPSQSQSPSEQPLPLVQPQPDPYDSSQDQQMLLVQKKRREQMERQRQQQVIRVAGFSQQELKNKALEDIEKTNMRVLAMRKKNQRRMQDIQKVRVTQQPYLVTSNTHYRGSISQYPLLTQDKTNRTLYHPNYSLRVGEMRLGEFIQKNIKEQTTANYLNEVVKFQNYAYQQRKKRRHHIQPGY